MEDLMQRLFGTHGMNPEEAGQELRKIAQTARKDFTGAQWDAADTVIRALAIGLGVKFAEKNPAFMLGDFLKWCDVEDK